MNQRNRRSTICWPGGWRLGQGCGLAGLPLLYWLRFLNAGIVAALIGVGYAATRLIFPTRPFFQIDVPALVAFMPQQAFYCVQNDVLSPLCFGLAFICLALWLRAGVPGSGLGVATGLALAACYLTKLSNLPLLAVAALVVLLKTWSMWRAGTSWPASRALVWLVLCAGLPVGAWLVWSKFAFGDFTGSALKLQAITWTLKPFHAMVAPSHFFGGWFVDFPVGTPGGVLAGRISLAWDATRSARDRRVLCDTHVVSPDRGCGQPLAAAEPAQCISTPDARAVTGLFRRRRGVPGMDVGHLRFRHLHQPSRGFPYFIAGRLILGPWCRFCWCCSRAWIFYCAAQSITGCGPPRWAA